MHDVTGSLKWIRKAIATRPDLLQPKRLPRIEWRSPIAATKFVEYRDEAFLTLVGLGRLADDLHAFWPLRGPVWEAIGMLPDSGVVVVEAKTHPSEFHSPSTMPTPSGYAKMQAAFGRAKAGYGVAPDHDWPGPFFQYALALTHLWWLREHGVNAHLLHVCFLGDAETRGPTDPAEWKAAFAEANAALGLAAGHPFSAYIHHLCPDVRGLD